MTILSCHVWNGNLGELNSDHDWNGCICEQCGKTRDQQHVWDGCECRRCHIDGNHNWVAVSSETVLKDYVPGTGYGYGTPPIDRVATDYVCDRCGQTKREEGDVVRW